MKAIFNTSAGIYRTNDRLAHYRKEAATAPAHMLPHYGQWKAWKHSDLWGTPNNVRTEKGAILSDSLDQYGDYLGDAESIVRLDHTGWYADGHFDDLIKGGVCRLRCPKGTMYIPVTYCTGWDGTIHYVNDVQLVPKGASESEHEEAKRQAARDADHYAEREAEENREAWEKDQRDEAIAYARYAVHQINRKALALIKEIRQAGKGFTPEICDALQYRLSAMMKEKAAHYSTIQGA